MIAFPPRTEEQFTAWTRELERLTPALRASLSCELHEGYPCNTCRWDLVTDMANYLRLHGYAVVEPGEWKPS